LRAIRPPVAAVAIPALVAFRQRGGVNLEVIARKPFAEGDVYFCR
jgi:hypothetical protein